MMTVRMITAQQARDFSKYILDITNDELDIISGKMNQLLERWDERRKISEQLSKHHWGIYGAYPKAEEIKQSEELVKKLEALKDEWWKKRDEDEKYGKALKSQFDKMASFILLFYSKIPYEKRRYFKEMDTGDIKHRIATFLGKTTYSNHMFFRPGTEVMEWVGFRWRKGVGWIYKKIKINDMKDYKEMAFS